MEVVVDSVVVAAVDVAVVVGLVGILFIRSITDGSNQDVIRRQRSSSWGRQTLVNERQYPTTRF